MIKIYKQSKWYLMITGILGVVSTSAMENNEVSGMKADSSKWYGGPIGESYYSERTPVIINEFVEKLKGLVKSADGDEEKLVAYYEQHLRSLGEARKDIAIKTDSEDADDFGLPNIDLGEIMFTPLSLIPQYAKWYDCVRLQLISHLQQMGESGATNAEISYDDESSITITIEPLHLVLRNPKYSVEIEGFTRTPRPKGMAQPLNQALSQGRLYLVKSQMKVLCDGKWIPTIAYLTAIYTQNQGDEVLNESSIKTLDNCGILAIHAKEIFIPPLLKKTANIWKNALLCDGSEMKVKSLLVDFRHMTSQLTYFKRGSAAIAEWDQEILLSFHGLNASYKNDWTKISVDLNALTFLKSPFKKLFETNVSIEPKNL